MLWLTADPHFGHRNIIGYCGRPHQTADGQPDVALMNLTLFSNWNERVESSDIVIVAGDFSFGNYGALHSYVANLNGRKVLARGNHDRHSNISYLRAGFEAVEKHFWLDDPRFGGPPGVLVVHRPEDAKKWSDRFKPRIVLCGHVHERWAEQERDGVRFINVGVDVRGFRPVSLKELGL